MLFHADAGHAWLEVTHQELIDSGVAPFISMCSYVDAAHAYLEEDQDAAIFLDAIGVDAKTLDTRTGSDRSSIRDKAAYNVDHYLKHPDHFPKAKDVMKHDRVLELSAQISDYHIFQMMEKRLGRALTEKEVERFEFQLELSRSVPLKSSHEILVYIDDERKYHAWRINYK